MQVLSLLETGINSRIVPCYSLGLSRLNSDQWLAVMTPLVIPECLFAVIFIMLVVAAICFRPRFFSPRRVKQDKERQVVEIEGIELSGWITKKRCKKCKDLMVYHEQYDEDFCPKCNEWAEPESTHPVWAQFKRPERPSPKKITT